jgi:hypothetical protein
MEAQALERQGPGLERFQAEPVRDLIRRWVQVRDKRVKRNSGSATFWPPDIKQLDKDQAPLWAPDSSHLPSRTSAVDAMMAAVMMAPVVVVAPMAVAADAARTLIGHDDAAAGIRIIGIIIVRVIVVVASDEEAPEVVPVVDVMAAIASDAATDRGAGAGRTALNGHAAATTPPVSTAVPTTMPAVPTADFPRQPVGGNIGCGRGTWINQRQGSCALAGGDREGQ